MIRQLSTCYVAFVVLASTMGGGFADDPPKAPKSPPVETKEAIMKQKLAQSQKLLEGLALGDFKKIEAAADELAILRNKAGWMVYRTREYQMYSNDFQRQIEATQKAAKKKNVDAAALAYVEMTLTCVKCHQHVREEAIGLAPRLTPTHVVGR